VSKLFAIEAALSDEVAGISVELSEKSGTSPLLNIVKLAVGMNVRPAKLIEPIH
jgi:hypothetical protein